MKHCDWTAPIAQIIRDGGGRGGLVTVFPEYRPDRFAALAAHLEFRSFDFRSEVMSKLGWDADRLSLQDLNSTLSDLAIEGGTVVNNVEALLSTKSPQECAAWIDEFLATDWEHALVIPMVIHTAQVPDDHPRVHRIPGDGLAEQSFLNRLVF